MIADTRTVTLAHPLNRTYAEEVYARETRDYRPGEQITVPTNQLLRLVNAGLIKDVDPADSDAVRALFIEQPDQAPADVPAGDMLPGTDTAAGKTGPSLRKK